MLETPTAVSSLLPEGVVQTAIRQNADQSLDDAKVNLAVSIEARGGQRRPLLIDMRFARPLAPEVRHYYSGELLDDSFTALGLLIESSVLGRMMGNVYLRVAKPGIPTKLFTDQGEAVAWLMRYR